VINCFSPKLIPAYLQTPGLQLVHQLFTTQSAVLYNFEHSVALPKVSSSVATCATSRKVAGSIPDGVIGIFYWHNPSGSTMTLRSTQPLTEMSTRNISWGKGCRYVGLTTLPPSCVDCLEIWEPQPPGTLTACPGPYRGCFTLPQLHPTRKLWRLLERECEEVPGRAAAGLRWWWWADTELRYLDRRDQDLLTDPYFLPFSRNQ
jgi:hypothetical protein